MSETTNYTTNHTDDRKTRCRAAIVEGTALNYKSNLYDIVNIDDKDVITLEVFDVGVRRLISLEEFLADPRGEVMTQRVSFSNAEEQSTVRKEQSTDWAAA